MRLSVARFGEWRAGLRDARAAKTVAALARLGRRRPADASMLLLFVCTMRPHGQQIRHCRSFRRAKAAERFVLGDRNRCVRAVDAVQTVGVQAR